MKLDLAAQAKAKHIENEDEENDDEDGDEIDEKTKIDLGKSIEEFNLNHVIILLPVTGVKASVGLIPSAVPSIISTQFYKQLPQPTTDDIEMRLCRDERASNENIFIDPMLDIYVRMSS